MSKIIEEEDWAEALQQTSFYHVSCPECGLNFFVEEYCVDEGMTRGMPEQDSSFSVCCPLCKQKITQVASDSAKVWLSIVPIPQEEENLNEQT